ncbi:alpha/beta hydrolase [Brevibacillus daliensis]|uniref:alpha/beta hydrolase n=1 Tax=Brevibacillus daliensis TaxID=2892995 RepID=UPI001E406037|nr:alpha/beta hydrolase [Brevibacillus daliensis]
MVKKILDSSKGYNNIDVPYTLLSKTEDAKNLVILLPGTGYTVQSPLLHYSTGIYLNKSFDVLHVNYQYNTEAYQNCSIEDVSEAIRFDVKTVIDKVISETNYEHFHLLAKSFGTVALSSELQRDIFTNAKAIWLTPLLHRDDVFDAMVQSHHDGLCMIGDNDPYYLEDRYNQLANKSNMTTRLIPQANHSLEYDDSAIASIDILKNVLEDIEAF